MSTLTDAQKVLAFDANKEAKKNINKLMTAVGTNGLCVPIAATYVGLTRMMNALVAPVAMYKAAIVSALDNNPVMDALNQANSVMSIVNSSLGKLTLQVDANTLQGLNIFSKVCLDFNDILPNAMKRMIDGAIDTINQTSEDAWDSLQFDYPIDVVTAMEDAETFFKDNALSEAFDEGIKVVLSPLQIYRDFIKNSGIVEILKRLQKFEKCMTNPQTCNRPKKEFYYPNTNKYNSQYYLDLLAINLKGEVLLGKLNKDFKTFDRKMAKTLKAVNDFRQPVKV